MEIRKITGDDYHLIREIDADDEMIKAIIFGVSNGIKGYSVMYLGHMLRSRKVEL